MIGSYFVPVEIFVRFMVVFSRLKWGLFCHEPARAEKLDNAVANPRKLDEGFHAPEILWPRLSAQSKELLVALQ